MAFLRVASLLRLLLRGHKIGIAFLCESICANAVAIFVENQNGSVLACFLEQSGVIKGNSMQEGRGEVSRGLVRGLNAI